MRNRIINRAIGGVVFAFIFCVFQITIQTLATTSINKQIAEEKLLYGTVDVKEFLQASFEAESFDLSESRVIKTTFKRTVPFSIPTLQQTTLRAFCNGNSVLLRTREAIPITLTYDPDVTEIAVSYNLDDWGFEKVARYYKDCEFVISKEWRDMEFPHGVKRGLELKATFKIN